MLLTASLVVCDDADVLDQCLSSLRGLVDEIVVVDLGSTDATLEVAAAHDALIDEAQPTDDDAIARNRSFDLAHGEWILCLDACERLHVDDPDTTRRTLHASNGAFAFRVQFVPRAGWTSYRQLRLWRQHPEIRYDPTVDSSVVPTITRIAEGERRTIELLERCTIDRDDERSRARRRDEPRLLAAITNDPSRVDLVDRLARVYEADDDSERAVATWRRGIDIARRRATDHPDDQLLYVDLLSHLVAQEALDADFGDLVGVAESRYSAVPTVQLAAARYEFATGRPREAIPRLEQLIAQDEQVLVESDRSYDRRVFDEWAWDLLGLCKFQLGDDAGAAAAFRAAERAAPDVAAYGVRRRLAEARARSGETRDAGIDRTAQ